MHLLFAQRSRSQDIFLDDNAIALHDVFLADDVALRGLSLFLADKVNFGVCRARQQRNDTDNAKRDPCELHVRYSPILYGIFDRKGVAGTIRDTNTVDQSKRPWVGRRNEARQSSRVMLRQIMGSDAQVPALNGLRDIRP